jgi:hypothetical protein
MKYCRTPLLFILFIVISSGVNGQGQINFKAGQIVTLENDTLNGLIYNSGELKKTRLCVYKADKTSSVIEYGPNDIKSYRINNGKYYVSREIEYKGKQLFSFLEVFIEGNINLYKYNVSSTFYIERKGGQTIALINKEEKLPDLDTYDTKSQYVLVTKIYHDTLHSLFSDCPPVLNEIEIVEYNRKSLMHITKRYLELTSQEANNLKYERDLRLSKSSFGVYTGLQFSKILFTDYLVDSHIESSALIGVFYNIPLPLFSERFSFQAELIASRLNYNKPFINNTSDWDDISIKSTVIGVPLLLNYEFPLKNITPSIGIGKETAFIVGSSATYKTQRTNEWGDMEYGDVDFLVHRFQKEGWFADIGINSKINPKFSFYSSLRFQRNINLIIADEYYNGSTFDIAETFVYSTKYYTYSGTLRVGLRF